MKQRPILFSTPMVKANLEDIKSETRRVMNPQPSEGWEPSHYGELHKKVNGEPDINKPIGWGVCSEDGYEGYLSPYGQPGDLLYVRESIYCHPAYSKAALEKGICGPLFDEKGNAVSFRGYVADGKKDIMFKTIPSIHAPKAASRIWLKVKEVKIERVQDITQQDSINEGILSYHDKIIQHWVYKDYLADASGYGHPDHDYPVVDSPIKSFQTLWNSINADRKDNDGNPLNYDWDSNPYVWVVKYEILSKTGKP